MSAGSPSQAGDRRSGGPELPVERLRAGYYTDAYFNNARAVLEADGHHPHVLMQVFQRHRSELGGMDEALDCLRAGAARRRSDGGWEPAWEELEVRALPEGASLEPWETVLTIEGDYALFAHTETVYLGCLARGTRIRTNVARAVAAARGKEVLYFAARHDHYLVQASDGFAALAAGAAGITTDAQGSRLGARGLGTVPHGLIAAYAGDTARAADAFAAHLPDESRLTVLVDFENDSIATALETAERLGDRLWGVRLDTAGSLIDRALANDAAPEEERQGVTPELARRVRAALDDAGYERVRIVVSGGFDADRITAFEREGVPVDVYGVGSSLLRGENDFTADVIRVDGRPCAKAGREERPNPRLEVVP